MLQLLYNHQRFPNPDTSPTVLVDTGSESLALRPRILFGMGDEDGEPLYIQALGFRMGRLPR